MTLRIVDALRIGRGDVVTLVGGGGKTTVMFRLAEELVAAGLTVISTMTTKIFVGQMARAPKGVLLCEDGGLPPGLEGMVTEHRHVLIGGCVTTDREKVEGVPPEIVDGLAADAVADVIIVEGDGSRRLPFKAPAEHEPVVPRCTTVLIPIVGLDVLGQRFEGEHVHRPQLVSALTGTASGERVTADIVAKVLAHPRGGAKGLPDGARLVPYLNKADLGEVAMEGARQIALALASAMGVDEVAIGAAETAEPVREVWGHIAAVVLAAGEGRRFGKLKQVMPWQGVPLVAHVVGQALACPEVNDVVVTVGAQAGLVHSVLADVQQKITVIDVADWGKGQSQSVRSGLHAAQIKASGRLSAALFLLADQPGVTPELLSALIQRHRETLAPVIAPRHNGKRGNPVLFDRRVFGEFEQLEGDAGARRLIRRHETEVAWVDWASDEILRDIDTPEDYDTAAQG